jgi:hypothetical protein
MPQDTDHHITVCQGEVRQCLTCGGRMCDCGSEHWDYQVFHCIHCGETEVDERERDSAPVMPSY